MQSVRAVAQGVFEIAAEGAAEVFRRLVVQAELLGHEGVDGGAERGAVIGQGLVIIPIGP